MEINRSKVWRTLQSPVFPWRTEVSFYSKLSLWSWLRMKEGGRRGLTYLPLWIPFVGVCGAKSFGSNFFNYLHNDLHSRLHFHLFFSHVNWAVFSFNSDLESDLLRQLSWATTAMTLPCASNKNSNAASKFYFLRKLSRKPQVVCGRIKKKFLRPRVSVCASMWVCVSCYKLSLFPFFSPPQPTFCAIMQKKKKPKVILIPVSM